MSSVESDYGEWARNLWLSCASAFVVLCFCLLSILVQEPAVRNRKPMYHYETLGDERFQELCQALISTSFPDAQCLPVGQPDGGRDAFLIHHHFSARRSSREKHELIVFQVKYVRNPSDTRSERDMIEDLVKKESTKISKLKGNGLAKYYLITNIKGTAHLDNGTIDRIDSLLTTLLGIEAHCWWRDDIDRRLDGNSSVKWSYPEILKATDLLQTLVSGNLGEHEERRRSAVRAYMTVQYEHDKELKFKQTDLRATIEELFVDLPMEPSTKALDSNAQNFPQGTNDGGVAQLYYERNHIASAEYILNTHDKDKFSRIVLEGAPGHGKSTVTQYICQILRTKLLDKFDDINRLPKQYKNVMIRIPFRVDLRDLAKWLAGIDPFQPKQVELDNREPKSLEGFLAAQVRVTSGGHEFNVSDLMAVARASHIFLALDGFDEVADVNLREQLVVEITKGTTRLMSVGGFSVKTIVTSRPAAFAKSVRFPRDQWSYFELLPLERRHVDDYTSKWMRAKGMKDTEQSQLRLILDTKLKEPHTQFLAKNPMQLTILLSLIHNRGSSLPEKRTAMYDAYMDMFFSRECEKSDIVRDNRDLLIDIHRYLAWKLQTAAEAGDNGSIERGALRRMLLVYLDEQGEDTNTVTDLFNGIVERVGALVSRVQETFEFEVQPLREYFAARHLYETAPYSPAGNEKAGTKLERFDALVRNPYWLNVARFYAGCFSKGEISALVDQIIELSNSDPYILTSHPRGVASMLLGDWVFAQYQPAVKKVIALISEYPKLRQLLAGQKLSALPDRSGRSDLVEILWTQLICSKFADERAALANAIIENSSVEERSLRWISAQEAMTHREWAKLGNYLQIFRMEGLAVLKPIQGNISSDLMLALLEAYQLDYLESPKHFEVARHLLLDEIVVPDIQGRSVRVSSGRLALLAKICGYYQYGVALNETSTMPLERSLERIFGPRRSDKRRQERLPPNMSENELKVLEAYRRFLNTPTGITSTSIEVWVDLVESARAAWGDCRAIDRIAFIGAGIRCKDQLGIDCRLENAKDLLHAARFIRLKSGSPRWWEERLKSESAVVERKRLLLLLWMWGTPTTIASISSVLADTLAQIDAKDWVNLCNDYACVQFWRRSRAPEIKESEINKIKKLGSRACMFIGARAPANQRFELATVISESDAEIGSPEIQFAMDTIISLSLRKRNWRAGLAQIKSLYQRGGSAHYPIHHDDTLPEAVARQISTEPGNFPLPLLFAADNIIRSAAGKTAPKLLDVADREGWFQ